MNSQNRTSARNSGSPFTATLALACFTYSALALLLLHGLRPDYTPAHHMISDYAVGRYSWIMTSWFVAMSCGLVMLLLGLARSGPASAVARVGTTLLGLASIGLLVSAGFPTDVEGTPSTRTGVIHTLSFLVNVVSIILAILLLSISFRDHPGWRGYQRTAITLTSLILLAFGIQFFTLFFGGPFGFANRFFVTMLFAWLFATSIQLRRETSVRTFHTAAT
jgi:hypothetical protein